MDCLTSEEISVSAFELLFKAVSLIPISNYVFGCILLLLIFLYNFLEFHLIADIMKGYRGDPVSLTFNPCSEIYEGVVSKCKTLHGRYLATPWLSSPHFQTVFLNFHGKPPVFSYRRQIFHTADGGTIALDWLPYSDVSTEAFHKNNSISKDDATPIVVVIPGLTSDSSSPYLKHLAFNMAKRGRNVVVGNHRGLGGISVTSDCFYNAGWTEDVRKIIDHLHGEYPQAPLFVVGTSIGANILICDRFICRRLVQRLYDRALTIGLQGYAQLHQPVYSRLGNWEGIEKARSIRDFDSHATCLVAKYETVDTYYRRCSSTSYVGNVSVPLLCISALDDPLCTREAIPWDECRANKNIVLATTEHGGHLAFFEGLNGDSLWWVRAVDEFLSVLHASPFMHRQNKTHNSSLHSALESSIDQGPYLNVMEDGMVAAVGNEQPAKMTGYFSVEQQMIHEKKNEVPDIEEIQHDETKAKTDSMQGTSQPSGRETESNLVVKYPHDITAPIRRCIDQLSRQNRKSIWLLAYIAIITTWPLVGSALLIVFKRKLKSVLPAAWLKR
ncbi:phospholipase ABHD3-like isoform X2 [Macadamia integrifolia]|uniref:phospholipase ABHD3-like isoform X2 n=1 Tax=Macadamia integrifolia TaxID=60698 RepID=UPI001C4E4B2B|nr:phospholipase ABHD3-like isoform X2 [Macadamia integrifolia]